MCIGRQPLWFTPSRNNQLNSSKLWWLKFQSKWDLDSKQYFLWILNDKEFLQWHEVYCVWGATSIDHLKILSSQKIFKASNSIFERSIKLNGQNFYWICLKTLFSAQCQVVYQILRREKEGFANKPQSQRQKIP